MDGSNESSFVFDAVVVLWMTPVGAQVADPYALAPALSSYADEEVMLTPLSNLALFAAIPAKSGR